jgi:hypothetical protein
MCRWQKSVQKFKEVYYESIKREPKIRGVKKCRCERQVQIFYFQKKKKERKKIKKAFESEKTLLSLPFREALVEWWTD